MIRPIRLGAMLLTCFSFMAAVICLQPLLALSGRDRRMKLLAAATSVWAGAMLAILGIRVRLEGRLETGPAGPFLLASNHLSYLDILILSAAFPCVFVAKSEVAGWPLIGHLSRLAPTIFIERGNARSNIGGFYRACGMLRRGLSVAVFPEGTTGDGTDVQKFNELFFASAIRTARPVLPLTINFSSVNGAIPDREALDLLCWYGDMDFAPHFWKLLAIGSAEVSLAVLEPITLEKFSRAESVARVSEILVKREFKNRLNEAKAESPVETSRSGADSTGHLDDSEPINDFLLGAILYSLLASNLNETVYEMIPRNEA